MSKLAENSAETARRIGRPFQPGQSGNPGGRPKGVARTVRELCGGDPGQIVQTLLKIVNGEGANGKPVRVADQIRAAELVLAYGWGKPPAVVSIECQNPLEPDDITRETARILGELVEHRVANSRSADFDAGTWRA